jgi:hypothetical protein
VEAVSVFSAEGAVVNFCSPRREPEEKLRQALKARVKLTAWHGIVPRFQRFCIVNSKFLGRCPRLSDAAASLALNMYEADSFPYSSTL